eukprot:jgi/Psemu1/47320/gm1.47320_g
MGIGPFSCSDLGNCVFLLWRLNYKHHHTPSFCSDDGNSNSEDNDKSTVDTMIRNNNNNPTPVCSKEEPSTSFWTNVLRSHRDWLRWTGGVNASAVFSDNNHNATAAQLQALPAPVKGPVYYYSDSVDTPATILNPVVYYAGVRELFRGVQIYFSRTNFVREFNTAIFLYTLKFATIV